MLRMLSARPHSTWALIGLVAALSTCRAIEAVDVYACEPDGSCPSGGQCCPDRYCRAPCAAKEMVDAGPPRDAGVLPTSDAGMKVDSGVLVIPDGGACVDGDVCSTNGNPCRAGYAVCATQSCIDSAAVIRSPGESCGDNKVCTSNGSCGPCTAGRTCANNVNTCR